MTIKESSLPIKESSKRITSYNQARFNAPKSARYEEIFITTRCIRYENENIWINLIKIEKILEATVRTINKFVS